MSSAATATYQYYRFRITAVRGSVLLTQLSEFKLFNGGNPVTGVTASDPSPGNYPSGESPPNAFDNNTGTKWLDFDYTKGRLYMAFSAPTAIDSYNYYTGNDSPERDPVSWVLEGSNSDPTTSDNWTPIDVVSNFVPTNSRNAIATATNFTLPANVKAVIDIFSLLDTTQPIIQLNGAAINLDAKTSSATSSILSSSGSEAPVTLNASTEIFPVVHPGPNALTTYTLTAQSAGGNATSSLKVRTVPGATVNYRYVRFTPLAVLGAGSTTIAMNDLSFYLGSSRLAPTAVENPGGTVVTGQGIANLIDDPNSGTVWSSANLSPVIIDFGSAQAFDGYSFITGSPTGGPTMWTMEGSNDKTTWTLFENVYYPFNTFGAANAASGTLPLDGAALIPAGKISTNVTSSAAGEAVTLTWNAAGATSASISGIGTVALSGSMTVNPTATTTYTLTSTGPGGSSTAATTLTVFPTIPLSFSYPNFSDHTNIKLVGYAAFINDFAHWTAAGNFDRIRLTDDGGSEQASAWYAIPIDVNDGFDTSFDAQVGKLSGTGADGVAFCIQNTPAGPAATSGGALYMNTNSVTVALDSYPDQAYEAGRYANLEVLSNNTLSTIVNLTDSPTAVAHGASHFYLADTNTAAAPYHVRVVYTGGKLSVYIDSVLVLDSFAISLTDAGAVDAKGRSYVGFNARTGGLSEIHDITAWSMTTTGATATVPLAVTSYSFNTSASTLALTWSSTIGKSYRITQSTDMVNWTTVPGSSTVAATTTSSNTTVTYTPAGAGYFRVELVP